MVVINDIIFIYPLQNNHLLNTYIKIYILLFTKYLYYYKDIFLNYFFYTYLNFVIKLLFYIKYFSIKISNKSKSS